MIIGPHCTRYDQNPGRFVPIRWSKRVQSQVDHVRGASERSAGASDGRAEVVGQDGGLADVGVLGGGEQRQGGVGGQGAQAGDRGAWPGLVELGQVAAAELVELRGIVAVPAAE